MEFERLDSVVERVLSRMVLVGEMGVDAPSQPTKRAEAEAPASSQGEVIQEGSSGNTLDYPVAASKAHMRPALPKTDRGMPMASIASTPHARAIGRPMFVVVIGGRETPEGGHRLPAYRCSPEGRAREYLKLVHAAPPIGAS